jgi:hypothetical protein
MIRIEERYADKVMAEIMVLAFRNTGKIMIAQVFNDSESFRSRTFFVYAGKVATDSRNYFGKTVRYLKSCQLPICSCESVDPRTSSKSPSRSCRTNMS